MEWSKVKSILLVLLLAVNLLLGFNIYLRIDAQREGELNGLRSALALLREKDVQFDEQIFFDMPVQNIAYTGLRSAEREGALAAALLGESSLDEAGGGVSIYTSQAGSVIFRSGGLFEAQVYGASDPAQVLDVIMKHTAVGDITGRRTETGEAQLFFGSSPVAGAVLRADTTDAGVSVSGRWYFGGEPETEGSGATRAEMAAALRSIGAERLAGGITGLHSVYVLEQQRGGVRFVPAWQVSLQEGQVVLGGITKAELAVE